MKPVSVGQVLAFMEQWAPQDLAESWDNPGLLVDCGAPVAGILTALEVTGPVIREAAEEGCGLIVCHHPVIFHPLKQLGPQDLAFRLAQRGISAICMQSRQAA